MAVENITTSSDLVAQSIDFAEQFNGSISTLLQVMGVTRMQPMAVGSQIKIYKSEVTKADGNVAEGEVIPLSKVTRKLADTKELAYRSIESKQRRKLFNQLALLLQFLILIGSYFVQFKVILRKTSLILFKLERQR